MAIQDFIGFQRIADGGFIDSAEVPGDLENFPVFFDAASLPDELVDADAAETGRSDMQDTVFSLSDWTRLSMDIVQNTKNANPALSVVQIHVKFPDVFAVGDTDFNVMWGNPGFTQPADAAAFGRDDVWSNSFVAINHMGNTSNPITDFSGNGNDLTGNGSLPDSVTAKVGTGQDFDGTGDFCSWVDGPVEAANDWTIELWAELDTINDWERIWDMGNDTTHYFFLTAQVQSTTRIMRFAIINGGAEQNLDADTAWELNTFFHVAVRQIGNTVDMYLDGVNVGTDTGITIDPADIGATANNWLGQSQFGADPDLDGILDEVRVSNVGRSPDWIAASYNNQNDPPTFITRDNTPIDLVIDTVLNYTEEGEITLAGSSASVLLTFGATVDLSKTIITFSAQSVDQDPSNISVRMERTTTTALFLRDSSASSNPITISYQLREYTAASGILVQDDIETGVTAGGESHALGTVVNPDKSYVLVGSSHAGTTFDFNDYLQADVDSTGENVVLDIGVTAAGINVAWQTIEIQNLKVQRLTGNVSANPSNSAITSVDVTKTFALGTFLTDDASQPFNEIYRLTINSATVLGRDKYAAALDSDIISIVGEFTDDTIVQEFSGEIAISETELDISIPIPVTIANSYIHNGTTYQTMFPTNQATDDGGEAMLRGRQTSIDNFRITREESAVATKYSFFLISKPPFPVASQEHATYRGTRRGVLEGVL